MDERVDPADITVEGPESPPKPSFPIVGVSVTPTPEMIAQGRVGNGAWDLTDESVQLAYAEQHQRIKEERDDRRKHFNEQAKDALADAITFHHRIVKRGLDVLDRIDTPSEDHPVTAKDMSILSMAQKSSKELADRGMGKSKAQESEAESTSLLQFFIKDNR